MSFRPAVFAVAAVLALSATITQPAYAEFAIEDEQNGGVLNPADFSYRYYVDAMNRFPDRIGMICVHAYELDKSGAYAQSFTFFSECARRGNPPSMVYLSMMYDQGHGVDRSPATSTSWIKKAAETGYSIGQYHYGMALLHGYGTPVDLAAARHWLQEAAAQGDRDAVRVLAEEPAFHPQASN